MGNAAHLTEAMRDHAHELISGLLKAVWYMQKIWGLAHGNDVKQARARAAHKVLLFKAEFCSGRLMALNQDNVGGTKRRAGSERRCALMCKGACRSIALALLRRPSHVQNAVALYQLLSTLLQPLVLPVLPSRHTRLQAGAALMTQVAEEQTVARQYGVTHARRGGTWVCSRVTARRQ
jgi:hypothetical protein